MTNQTKCCPRCAGILILSGSEADKCPCHKEAALREERKGPNVARFVEGLAEIRRKEIMPEPSYHQRFRERFKLHFFGKDTKEILAFIDEVVAEERREVLDDYILSHVKWEPVAYQRGRAEEREAIKSQIENFIDERDDGMWSCRESFDLLLTTLGSSPDVAGETEKEKSAGCVCERGGLCANHALRRFSRLEVPDGCICGCHDRNWFNLEIPKLGTECEHCKPRTEPDTPITGEFETMADFVNAPPEKKREVMLNVAREATNDQRAQIGLSPITGECCETCLKKEPLLKYGCCVHFEENGPCWKPRNHNQDTNQ